MLIIQSNFKRAAMLLIAMLLLLGLGSPELEAAAHAKKGGEHGKASEHHKTDEGGHEKKESAHHGDSGHHGPVKSELTFVKKLRYSWLVAYMFFLSICLGCLFIVLLHHLFDAQWIVPIRRVCEHIACLIWFPMPLLALPFLLWPSGIYDWMLADPTTDHALKAVVKKWVFNPMGFYGFSAAVFLVLGYLARRLRYWSLQQDFAEAEDGEFEGKLDRIEKVITFFARFLLGHLFESRPSVRCSRMMNIHASYGIIMFVAMLTTACFAWVKALQYQWFSTMYGVYYFAGSVWVTCATVYMLMLLHQSQGILQYVIRRETYHDIAKLMFAFTVFYAYIHFSQYFLIWNAAIPEETFWYVQREKGSWWWIGQTIIFGHFFLPFLLLLRSDVKVNKSFMPLICIWAWLMHYLDMHFNIMPLIYPDGFTIYWTDFLAMGVIGGMLWSFYVKNLGRHPAYPQRDPRIAEAMGVYVEPEGGEPAH